MDEARTARTRFTDRPGTIAALVVVAVAVAVAIGLLAVLMAQPAPVPLAASVTNTRLISATPGSYV